MSALKRHISGYNSLKNLTFKVQSEQWRHDFFGSDHLL